jgi:hypothetical protein
LPAVVPTGTITLALIFTGEVDVGFTTALGLKAQLAPEMLGLKLHERVRL